MMFCLPARALCKHDHQARQEGILPLLWSTQGKVSRVLVTKYHTDTFVVTLTVQMAPKQSA